jgi:hypothetical protein
MNPAGGFVALTFAAIAFTACGGTSSRESETARASLYDTDFSTVFEAARAATTLRYHRVVASQGTGTIQTAWQQVSMAETPDASPDIMVKNGTGGSTRMHTGQATRYFVRFDIAITGGRPWHVDVVGHAASWSQGMAVPVELRRGDKPAWLGVRSETLTVAIHERIKQFAVPARGGPVSARSTTALGDAGTAVDTDATMADAAVTIEAPTR